MRPRWPWCTWWRGSGSAWFRLLDTQFVTSHLARFGAIEIPRERYKALLRDAVAHGGRPGSLPPIPATLDAAIAELD